MGRVSTLFFVALDCVLTIPNKAAAVTIDNLFIKKIIIVNKRRNPFRNGYWDVDLKYVFEYPLTFREADGCVIGSVLANSIFNKKVSLFGSVGSDLVISTDLFRSITDTTTLDAEPFVEVEAQGVSLSADIHYIRRRDDEFTFDPAEVRVTLGLFTIIKLFRIVNLTVESHGFCIPDECAELAALRPCEFFENLDFPMDIFAPPQKPEFFAGISGNIPPTRHGGCE